MQLCERYRPKSWEQFIGQDKAVAKVKAIIGDKDFCEGAGEALWISGPTGTGKTTMAQLIARQVGVEPKRDSWNYFELDGTYCSVAEVRDLDYTATQCRMFAEEWRVVVVNEAHVMRQDAVYAWLTLLEHLPARWVVIFTTTETGDLFGRFSSALFTRCHVIRFTNQGLANSIVAHVMPIAKRHGLDGKNKAAYLRLVQENHNSIRGTLQAIGDGEMKDS